MRCAKQKEALEYLQRLLWMALLTLFWQHRVVAAYPSFGNGLDDVPMLNDQPVFDAINVDDGYTAIIGRRLKEAVFRNEVPFRNDPPERELRLGLTGHELCPKRLQWRTTVGKVRVALDQILRDELIDPIKVATIYDNFDVLFHDVSRTLFCKYLRRQIGQQHSGGKSRTAYKFHVSFPQFRPVNCPAMH